MLRKLLLEGGKGPPHNPWIVVEGKLSLISRFASTHGAVFFLNDFNYLQFSEPMIDLNTVTVRDYLVFLVLSCSYTCISFVNFNTNKIYLVLVSFGNVSMAVGNLEP